MLTAQMGLVAMPVLAIICLVAGAWGALLVCACSFAICASGVHHFKRKYPDGPQWPPWL